MQYALTQLIEREPSLVTPLPRLPGQKEGRYAHLLCGEPDIPEVSYVAPSGPATGLGARVAELESQLEDIMERLAAIEEANRD